MLQSVEIGRQRGDHFVLRYLGDENKTMIKYSSHGLSPGQNNVSNYSLPAESSSPPIKQTLRQNQRSKTNMVDLFHI